MPDLRSPTAKIKTRPVQIRAEHHRLLKQLSAIKDRSMAELVEVAIEAMAEAEGMPTMAVEGASA